MANRVMTAEEFGAVESGGLYHLSARKGGVMCGRSSDKVNNKAYARGLKFFACDWPAQLPLAFVCQTCRAAAVREHRASK